VTISQEKLTTGFWLKWAAALVVAVPFAILAGLIAGSIVHALFWPQEPDVGTPLSNIFVYLASGAVFGAVMYTVQWAALRSILPISASWILLGATGFAIGETLVGIALWPLGVLRTTLGMLQGEAHEPEAVILAFCAAWAGLLQTRELNRHVHAARWWVVGSAMAWGAGGLVMFRPRMIFVGAALMALISGYMLDRELKGPVSDAS